MGHLSKCYTCRLSEYYIIMKHILASLKCYYHELTRNPAVALK